MPLPREHFKVFISHATSEDSDLVNWMAESLDRLHIRAFVYERYPMGGRNRFDWIKQMINVCPYFMVLLTRAGIASQWVNQEIGCAVGFGKNIIPIVEVDVNSGRRIQSSGFVELHDPINYYPNEVVRLMADILYTFYGWLLSAGEWRNLIFLSCRCGHTFEGDLQFDEHWEMWLRLQRPFPVVWNCVICQSVITMSFPDCHLSSQ